MSADEPIPPRTVSPELLVVLGCAAIAVLLAMPPLLGVRVAVGFVVVSFVLGTLAGIGYHVALHRTLAPLARGWWWHPTRCMCSSARRNDAA